MVHVNRVSTEFRAYETRKPTLHPILFYFASSLKTQVRDRVLGQALGSRFGSELF